MLHNVAPLRYIAGIVCDIPDATDVSMKNAVFGRRGVLLKSRYFEKSLQYNKAAKSSRTFGYNIPDVSSAVLLP